LDARRTQKVSGYAAIAALGGFLLISLSGDGICSVFGTAFNGAFVEDALALFFKRFFLVAAILLFMSAEFSDRIAAAFRILFAHRVCAGGNVVRRVGQRFRDAVRFHRTHHHHVLRPDSFQRSRLVSLEAGVKYLILGALSSAFMVFGIALIWGTTGKLNFNELAPSRAISGQQNLPARRAVRAGRLGFKIAAFPFQIWAPDVYQGAPTPTTAFLAVGSKAAGFVLLLRVLFTAVPSVTAHWANLLIVISGITILYGNLCAIPQRNLKRLLGYSSIAHAGYLLLGVAALSASGQAAVLYYLAGYLFTVLAAFTVIAGDAASGHGGHFRIGRLEPAFAAAGRDDDAGDGFAGGHSAAGRIFREISAAQIRD
jgi:NADH-quinone oxidoreductase subunit N